MTQEEILRLMKTDSDAGMQIVTNQYAALVYKVVWGKLACVCSSEDVEEAVSDVFLDFFRSHHLVDLSKGSLTTFLITLAQRRAVDVLRKFIRQQNIDNMLSDRTEDSALHTENEVLKSEEREIILNSILSLGEPAQCRKKTLTWMKNHYAATQASVSCAESVLPCATTSNR